MARVLEIVAASPISPRLAWDAEANKEEIVDALLPALLPTHAARPLVGCHRQHHGGVGRSSLHWVAGGVLESVRQGGKRKHSVWSGVLVLCTDWHAHAVEVVTGPDAALPVELRSCGYVLKYWFMPRALVPHESRKNRG